MQNQKSDHDLLWDSQDANDMDLLVFLQLWASDISVGKRINGQ